MEKLTRAMQVDPEFQEGRSYLLHITEIQAQQVQKYLVAFPDVQGTDEKSHWHHASA